MAIFPVVQARPDRLFKTMSKRIRGEAPNAVALRRKVGEKLSSAIRVKSRSTRVLHSAYAVCGFTGELSSTSPSATPYTLHDDMYTKRSIPTCLARVARCTDPW